MPDASPQPRKNEPKDIRARNDRLSTLVNKSRSRDIRNIQLTIDADGATYWTFTYQGQSLPESFSNFD